MRRALKARLFAYYEFLTKQPVDRFVTLLRERRATESRDALRSRQRD